MLKRYLSETRQHQRPPTSLSRNIDILNFGIHLSAELKLVLTNFAAGNMSLIEEKWANACWKFLCHISAVLTLAHRSQSDSDGSASHSDPCRTGGDARITLKHRCSDDSCYPSNLLLTGYAHVQTHSFFIYLFIYLFIFLQKVHFPVIMYNFPLKKCLLPYEYLYGQPAEKE